MCVFTYVHTRHVATNLLVACLVLITYLFVCIHMCIHMHVYTAHRAKSSCHSLCIDSWPLCMYTCVELRVCIHSTPCTVFIMSIHVCIVTTRQARCLCGFPFLCVYMCAYKVAKTHRIPKLQSIFHKRATKYRSLLRKMTYKDKGSYESSPHCSDNTWGKTFVWLSFIWIWGGYGQ